MKLLDKIVDWLLTKLIRYKNKRKIDEIRKRDPFIYN
jgi:hypothetical protein